MQGNRLDSTDGANVYIENALDPRRYRARYAGTAHYLYSNSNQQQEPDSHYSQKLATEMQMELDNLNQRNRKLLDDNRHIQNKCTNLKKQLEIAERNSINGINSDRNYQYCNPPPPQCMDDEASKKFAKIDEKLDFLINAYKKDEEHKSRMVYVVDKVGVIENQLNRIESMISKNWADVHDYAANAPGMQSSPSAVINSPQFIRRSNGPVTEIELIDSGYNAVQATRSLKSVIDANYGNNKNTRTSTESRIPEEESSDTTVRISLDRRPSDSTSATTIEAGYCDDADEPGNASGTQLSGEIVEHDGDRCENLGDNPMSEDNLNVRVRRPVVLDGDIEIVAEVTPTKSVIQSSPLNQAGKSSKNVSNTPPIGGLQGRKSSVFTSLVSGSGHSKRYLDFDGTEDFEDSAITNNSRLQESSAGQSLDLAISNLNGIFDASPPQDSPTNSENTFTGNCSTPYLSKRKNIYIDSRQERKKIRGISKAPVKRESGPVDADTVVHTGSSSSLTNKPDNAVPYIPDQITMENTLLAIKKERVAHAIDTFDNDRDVWKCICGHETATRCGLKLHVKTMGTEEAHFKCPRPNCNGRFLFPYLVKNHIIKDHRHTVPDKLHGCEKCYNIFYNKVDLKTHKNDRNEICRSAPRRRRSSNPSNSSSDRGKVLPVTNPSITLTGSNSARVPSIILTL